MVKMAPFLIRRSFIKLLFLLQVCDFILPSEALKNGFTIKVNAGGKECFFEDVKTNVSLEIEFQVIEGGELDIDFYVKLPSGKMAIEDIRKSDEVHTLPTTEVGTYEFCFDNSYSNLVSKTVFADLGVDSTDQSEEFPTGTKDSLVEGLEEEPLTETLEKIRGSLERATHLQNYLRSTEARDFKLVKSNLNRVFWWSIIQSFALVGVALVQVNIVKHFFGGGKYKTRV